MTRPSESGHSLTLTAIMNWIVLKIDQLNDFIGKTISWLSFALVMLIVVDVFLRYVLKFSVPATFELEWHLFAAIFLLAAGWTLRNDQHVRVDLFYHNFSNRGKAWVNLLGTLFLLLPFCIVGLTESFDFTVNSWKVGETSPDPGGLPGRYVVKSFIPIGFFLLGLQGVSIVLKSLAQIMRK